MICFPRWELLLCLLEIVKFQYVLAQKLYSKQDWFLYETNWRRLFPHDKLSFEVLMCFCWRLDLHLLFWKSVAAHGGRQLSCSFAYLPFRLPAFTVKRTSTEQIKEKICYDRSKNLPNERYEKHEQLKIYFPKFVWLERRECGWDVSDWVLKLL